MPTMASRSPSPNPLRASNPNPRTPDGISNRWNSCSKPSNTFSDVHQRNSCRAGSVAAAAGSPRASFEHKENAVGRSRSPAMSSSAKCAKNFMSPTISASSKVTAASPRRKVLGERNEAAVRSSFSSLPAAPEMPAADEAPVKPDAAIGIPQSLRDAEQMPKQSSDVETKYHCSDDLVESVAPLDADPRLPPYDPETNYLSPRPRFLHYRPNPRIESSIHCELDVLETNDGRRLDDSFSSEINEESSVLSEEEHSSDPGKELFPYPEEDCEEQSSKPLEEGCEEQIPDPQEDYEEQSSDQQSDCEDDISLPGANVVPELAEKPSGGTGSSTLRYKIAPILLVSVMACLLAFFWGTSFISSSSSVLNVPVLQVVNDLHIREHVVNSAMHVKELTSRLRHLPFGTFGLYGTLVTLPEFGPFYAANLTAAASADQEVATDYSYRWMLQSPDHTVEGIQMEQSYWVNVEEERSETDESETEAKDAGILEEAENTQEFEVERQMEDDSVDVLQDAELLEEKGSMQEPEMELQVEAVREQDLESKFEAVEGQEDGTATQFQLSGSDASNSESSDDPEISNGLNPQEFLTFAYDSRLRNKLFLGISSAILLLAASLIFLSRKRRQMPVVLDESKTPPPAAKLMTEEFVSGSNNSCVQNSDSPFHDTPADMMMVDDSGPSESSTGLQQQSLSVGRRRASRAVSGDENSNIERQTRRDSVSSASISYGSFTTFEKLSAKKGPRDDEAMTPVRRSSRIRKQIASP